MRRFALSIYSPKSGLTGSMGTHAAHPIPLTAVNRPPRGSQTRNSNSARLLRPPVALGGPSRPLPGRRPGDLHVGVTDRLGSALYVVSTTDQPGQAGLGVAWWCLAGEASRRVGVLWWRLFCKTWGRLHPSERQPSARSSPQRRSRGRRTIGWMLHALLQVILYGILAGVSPMAFAATITVMQAGRLKALGFGVGFVSAQLLTCSVFVGVDIAAVGTSRMHHPGVQFALEAAMAVVLIWLAGRIRRRPPSEGEAGTKRTRKLLERLDRLRLLTAVTAGVVLGIGVPKRLVLALLAATTINTAGVRLSGQAALVVIYVAVATAIVWLPVALFILFGDRAITLMRHSQDEVVRRQPQVTVHALQFLAAVFAIDAAGMLLTQIL